MPKEKKPERASRMQIAALALIVVVFVAYVLLFSGGSQAPVVPEPKEQQISMEQFESTVLGSPGIVIVMDLRDSPGQNSSNAILQCGVNLAFSLSQLNKTIGSYAYDPAGACYSSDGNYSVPECEGMMGPGYRFIVGYGPGATKMYRNRTLISTSEFYGSACEIKILTAAEPKPPWELVDPNATAKTANMSFGEIYAGCLAREVCSEKTPDEADACLRAYAVTVGGDPHCCFGLSTPEGMNECILSTAGQSHGISADYCQFLPQPSLDECYYEYGTNYFYYAYCNRITNSSLKSDCLMVLSRNGALPSQLSMNVSTG